MVKRARCFSVQSRGFTLIELLACLAIIGLLTAIVVPSMSRARRSAQRVACAVQLRSLTTATVAHAMMHRAMPVSGEAGPVLDLELDPRAWLCPGDRVRPEAAKGSTYAYLGLTSVLPAVDLGRPESIRAELAFRIFESQTKIGLFKEIPVGQGHHHVAFFDGSIRGIGT